MFEKTKIPRNSPFLEVPYLTFLNVNSNSCNFATTGSRVLVSGKSLKFFQVFLKPQALRGIDFLQQERQNVCTCCCLLGSLVVAPYKRPKSSASI